jgi:hypothetical protein
MRALCDWPARHEVLRPAQPDGRTVNPFMLREAIGSVALSHDSGCACDVCSAAAGDEDAFLKVALATAEFAKTADRWAAPDGTEWHIHNAEACADHPCAFHNPSEHHMKAWPLDMNASKDLLVERICRHGTRHPDPDSVAHLSGGWDREIGNYEAHECCLSRCCES